MKSRFWLLILLTCLIAYFAEFPVNVSALDETKPPGEKHDFVMQNEKPDNGLGSDDNEQGEKETFEFQTEVSRLMKIIINSLYKTREIFLRELISNASDAIDKIRFLSLTDPNALTSNSKLNITIFSDPENKALIISDSGVGMTKKQLRENLGTIAKSGTSEFLSAIEEKKADVNLIGQFGVGFYSAFLVADKVVVTTKHNDDEQYIWESQAINDFTIYKDPRGNTLGRGTQIKLYLKEDALSFLEEDVIRGLIAKYSEFINFPIWLWTKKTEVIETDETETEEKKDTDEKEKDSDEPDIEDITEDTEKEKKSEKKTETIEIPGWELMNTQKPLWARDPKNITDLEYENFYLSFTKDNSPPLSWIHYKGEGDVDFKAIIYIPSKAPDNLFQKVQDFSRNVKLFVKRVFITDEFLDFVPKYLAFIKAIIDADDLPLNVSRETLQQHKILQLIKKHIIKKALEMISNLSKDDEKYKKFLKEFGVSLKVGAIEDDNNRKKIAQLLRFPCSNKEVNWTSLDGYISRMKKKQDKMYFITGSSVEEIEKSPFIEGFIARGYEVLYMTDPIDEMLVQRMPGHGGKMFQNIAKDSDIGDVEEISELKFKFIKLTNWMQTILSDYVEKVKISTRLTTSPCAVAANEWGWTAQMERIMSGQVLKQENEFMKDFYTKQKKVLEINPNHPLILGFLDKVESDKVDDTTKEMVEVLYLTTLVRSGYPMEKNSEKFATKIEKILRINLSVDLNAKATVNIIPVVDDDKDEKKKEDLFDELDDDLTEPAKPLSKDDNGDDGDNVVDENKPERERDEL